MFPDEYFGIFWRVALPARLCVWSTIDHSVKQMDTAIRCDMDMLWDVLVNFNMSGQISLPFLEVQTPLLSSSWDIFLNAFIWWNYYLYQSSTHGTYVHLTYEGVILHTKKTFNTSIMTMRMYYYLTYLFILSGVWTRYIWNPSIHFFK